MTQSIADNLQRVNDADFASVYSQVRNRMEAACAADPSSECSLVPRFGGHKHYLYKYRVFRDVRLAFAAEQAIALYGAKNENRMFDVAFLRAYENDKPVDSSHNFLRVSAQRAAEGEAIFVSGNPGYTHRDMTIPEFWIELRRVQAHAFYLAQLRGFLGHLRTGGTDAKEASDPTFFLVELAYANNRNMLPILSSFGYGNAILKISQLKQTVANNAELKARLDEVLESLNRIDSNHRNAFGLFMVLEETNYSFLSEYFRQAQRLVRAAAERVLPDEQRLPEYLNARLPLIEALIRPDTPLNVELEIAYMTFALQNLADLAEAWGLTTLRERVLDGMTPIGRAEYLVKGSRLHERTYREQLYAGGSAAIQASQDPMVVFVRDVIEPAAREARKNFEAGYSILINRYLSAFNAIRFSVSGSDFYPDADSTLRMSYGRVKGPVVNGADQSPFTTLGQVFDLDKSSSAYQLPASWRNAKNSLDMSKPLGFMADTDEIGGNSGSPVVNARGELVALLWGASSHGLAYYGYNGNVMRGFMIDANSILDILNLVYDAARLTDEIRN